MPVFFYVNRQMADEIIKYAGRRKITFDIFIIWNYLMFDKHIV